MTGTPRPLLERERSDWNALRVRAGISLRTAEELTGLNRGLLSDIERGRTIPRPDECAAMLRAYRPEHPGGYPFDRPDLVPPNPPAPDAPAVVRRRRRPVGGAP